MSQRIKDGIFIDNLISVNDERREGLSVYMRILQFLAIFIGSISTSYILIDCLAIPVSTSSVNIALFIASIVLFALLYFPSYDLVKLILSVMFYGLFLFSRLPKLKNAFYLLENLVIDRIASYYGYQTSYYKANYSTAHADTTLLVIMIMLPIVTLLAIAVVRNAYVSICNVIMFLPVVATFAFGLVPPERFLVALLIVTLYISRTYINGHLPISREQKSVLQRVNSRAAIWLSVIGVTLFFLMKLLVSPQEYSEVTKIKKVKSDIQNYMYNFSIEDVSKRFSLKKLPYLDNASGGLNSGELGRVDQVNYNNTEHLRVWAPLPSLTEGMYLKGFVGSDYTGNSWVGHSKDDLNRYKELLKKLPADKFTPVNQVSQLLNSVAGSDENKQNETAPYVLNSDSNYQFYQGKIQIEYEMANKNYLYIPYFTDLDKTKAEEDRTDLYAAPVVKDGSYQFDYYFNLSLGANITDLFNTSLMNRLGEYSAYEKLYRDYVYSVYTKLPQKGLDRLKQDFSSRSPEIKGKSVAEKIDYVRNYLAENTQYSLSPGRLPKGKDFVEYFLYENKIGYCTHYASAATLMLRAMGIPARYVEGYAIGASDIVQNTNPSDQNITMYSDKSRYTIEAPQVEASVKDYNAHAWVEVYIDGSGWIPVEFTPGSAVSNTSKSVEDMTSIGDTIDEKVTPKAEPSVTPTPTQKPEENSQPTVTPVPAGKNRTDNMKPGDSSGQLFKLNAFQILLIVLGFTVIGLTLYILLRIRNKNIEKLTRNHNRKALLLYSEIERMLTSCRSLPGRGERLEDHVDYVKKNCPYLEDEAFDLCMNTVRKARFGKNSITLYELKELEKFHRNLYNDVYQKMPFSKKLYLKLMLLFA